MPGRLTEHVVVELDTGLQQGLDRLQADDDLSLERGIDIRDSERADTHDDVSVPALVLIARTWRPAAPAPAMARDRPQTRWSPGRLCRCRCWSGRPGSPLRGHRPPAR